MFFLGGGPHLMHMGVPRLGDELELQLQAYTQPQQCSIRTASATHTTAHGNARSLTYWARPRIKLVGFITTEPQREHTIDVNVWQLSNNEKLASSISWEPKGMFTVDFEDLGWFPLILEFHSISVQVPSLSDIFHLSYLYLIVPVICFILCYSPILFQKGFDLESFSLLFLGILNLPNKIWTMKQARE